MKIQEIKIADGVIAVEYEALDTVRIITGAHQARHELFGASQHLTIAAMRHFGVEGISCSFRSASISHGDNPGSRIMLSVTLSDGEKARMSLPKVTSHRIVDRRTGEDKDCTKNTYLTAIDEFVTEVEEFVKGKRKQMSLPFDPTEVSFGQPEEVAAEAGV